MVGGSGLYMNAVCNGFDAVPSSDKKMRADLTMLFEKKGIAPLQELLKKLDPEHYKKVDIKNPHRLIRAIEICRLTGKPYSEIRKGEKQKRNFTVIKIGLELPRETLYQRINCRVDEMMEAGLLEEVQSLIKYRNSNSLLTVGYKELFDHLDSKHTLQRAVELIKQNTRNFAKRQLTWFRKDKEISWFSPEDKMQVMDFVKNSQQ